MALSPEQVRDVLAKHRSHAGERDQTMAEIADRAAERESSPEHEQPRGDAVIHKQRPIIEQPEAVKPVTDDWARYIKRQLDSRDRSMVGAIADVLGTIEKKHRAALDEMRAEVATMARQVSELRAESKVGRALDDMQARLAQLETVAAERGKSLRAVS